MKVRLDFCDFGPGFQKTNNFFYNILKDHFDIQICDCPDFLIFGDLNRHVHRLYDCIKIYYCVENFKPDFRRYDYCFTCHETEDKRNLRLPYYTQFGGAQHLVKASDENPDQILASKTRFCCFLAGYANQKTRVRNDFFHKLCKYKKVDSAGRALNNMGRTVPPGLGPKLDFIRPYKFNIAFENMSMPGYTTEKICDAMRARVMPIYWGNPNIGAEFNSRSFLNYFDFPNEEALIEKIIELDRDDAKYLDYLRQPYFHDNKPNPYFSTERLVEFFRMIFNAPGASAPARREGLQFGRWMFVKKNRPN